MVQNKDNNEDDFSGCLNSFFTWKAIIVGLILLGYWWYYGSWDKGTEKWAEGVNEYLTPILKIVGIIAVWLFLTILCCFISDKFKKNKD